MPDRAQLRPRLRARVEIEPESPVADGLDGRRRSDGRLLADARAALHPQRQERGRRCRCHERQEKVLVSDRDPFHRTAIRTHERRVELAERDALHVLVLLLVSVGEMALVFEGVCFLGPQSCW